MIDRMNGRLALLLSVLLVLVLALGGWFALVSPQRSTAASLDTQIGDANVKLVTTQTFLRSPAAHQSIKDLRRLRVALPDDVHMSEILRQLSWASARTGVRIDTITPAAPVASSGGQAVPISLSLTGHYFRLANFMHLLRTRAEAGNGKVHASGRLYAVDNISFSSGEGGLITATVTLDAFSYSAVPAPAATATTTTSTTTP